MADLDLLLKYVRTGTAEGDRAFLQSVFITPGQLNELIGIEDGGMRLLVGNKGMGKSAIVEWMQKIYSKHKIACVLLRPDDLDTRALPNNQDVGSLKRHFYETLLHAVCGQIGKQMKAALVGDSAVLHAEARDQGLADLSFVDKALALLSAVSTPVGRIDGKGLAKDLSGGRSIHELIKAINTRLLERGSVFFLFVDDTDQVAAPGTANHLNRIWSLLLAVRRLVGECPNVRAIVTLRSEIWIRLTSESAGQRDQTDHLRGSVVSLRVSDEIIANIVRKRVQAAANDAGHMRGDPYPLFFAGEVVKLPTSDAERSWDLFLVKSSRERPRDAIQLIRNMIDIAKKSGSMKLGSAEAEEGMKIFSRERIDDLSNEFAPDCPQIREVVTSFINVEFREPFDELMKHLRAIPSMFSITIRGHAMKPQNDSDAIRILSLLHETGFINPAVRDHRQSRDFRHILFHEDPDFVKITNRNNMQGATWEVHPAFRSFLLNAKHDTSASDRSRR